MATEPPGRQGEEGTHEGTHEEAKEGAKGAVGLLRSSLVVGSMTMISRVLGLVRDVVIAIWFGSRSEADAFFVAFKIPNFLRRLFAEGAFSQAFVPVLSEYRTRYTLVEVKTLVNAVAGTLGLVLSGITVLGVAGAPVIVMVFAPGFHDDPDKLALAGDMLRITFPYLLFISLTAFCGAILNSYGRFAVPAFTPVLLNLSLITATVWLTPLVEIPVMALAWGVFMAGALQLLFQLPFLSQLRLLPVPSPNRNHEGVRRIMALMVPALFGVSVSQINLLLDTVLASFLQTGSISWLYYSDRLSELPLGIIGIAIGTVILPVLSRRHADDSTEAFSHTIDWALRLVLLIGVPAAVALVLLAEPLLTTLFQYGEMTGRDVDMAAKSLRAYGLGLAAFMLIKVLAPGYFARQNTRTPVRIAVIAMVANMVLNLLLIIPLQHAGLALATSLSAYLNALLLYLGLKRAKVYQPEPGWKIFLGRMLLANLIMGLLLLSIRQDVAVWLAWGVMDRAAYTALLVLAGLLAYLVSLLICGLRPRHLLR
jgi:putative peptidoglycan lipid II flippase